MLTEMRFLARSGHFKNFFVNWSPSPAGPGLAKTRFNHKHEHFTQFPDICHVWNLVHVQI